MAIGSISRANLRVVVLWDHNTGKSTLIASVASEMLPMNIQRVLPPTLTHADFYPDRVPPTIINTDCWFLIEIDVSSDDRSKLAEELKGADALILTYACDQPLSFDRLSTHWLQAVRHLQANLPIIGVGCKLDLKGDTEHVTMKEIMTPVMQQYREIEACLECSAFSHTQVHEFFYYAQKAVLHPTGPLYDQETQSLKPKCLRALKRICNACDHDMDGALNDDKLNEFQRMVRRSSTRSSVSIFTIIFFFFFFLHSSSSIPVPRSPFCGSGRHGVIDGVRCRNSTDDSECLSSFFAREEILWLRYHMIKEDVDGLKSNIARLETTISQKFMELKNDISEMRIDMKNMKKELIAEMEALNFKCLGKHVLTGSFILTFLVGMFFIEFSSHILKWVEIVNNTSRP